MKNALHIALFLVGLLGASAWIRSLDKYPFDPTTRSKIVHLQVNEGDYDTLFIGSSRVHYGIVPSAFDAALAAHGRASRSYSLGLSGYRPNDFDVLIDWVLANQPQVFKRVFIELHTFKQRGFDSNWMSWRQIHLHTPSTFSLRIETALGNYKPDPPAWEVACSVCMHTLTHALSVGRAPAILGDLLVNPLHRPDPRQREDHGWQSVLSAAEHNASLRRAHEKWLADEDPERSRRMKEQGFIPEHQKTGLPFALIRRRAERLRAAGIEVCFIVMPTMNYGFWGVDGVSDLAKELDVIDLDSPAAHPRASEPDGFYDYSHLAPEGARRVSALLADVYDVLLSEHGR